MSNEERIIKEIVNDLKVLSVLQESTMYIQQESMCIGELCEKEKIAKFLAYTFDCPCNFSPLDEGMHEYCGEDCQDYNIECWRRVLEKVLKEN